MKLSPALNGPLALTGFGLAVLGAAALAAACAKGQVGSGFDSPTDDGGLPFTMDDSGTPDFTGDGGGFHAVGGSGCANAVCNDFPNAPVMDMPMGGTAPPANVAQSFGAEGSGATTGGPCIYEPAPGALFPNNWLRPRFYWSGGGGGGQQVYELRFSSPHESNELVVYTTQTKWTMPNNIWQPLAQDLDGVPITVSIRQLSSGGQPMAGTSTNFVIAPVPAQGGMVFWSTNSFNTSATSTNLQGFQVGDETTATVLTPSQVAQPVWAQPPDGGNFPQPAALENVGCIGCHTSTPDGNYVGFTAQWPWPNALASVQADSGTPIGAAPPWLSQGAIANLGPNTGDSNYLGGQYIGGTTAADNNVDNVELGIQTFSKAHYANGDHVEVTSVGASADNPQIPNSNPVMSTGVEASCKGGTSPCTVSQLIWIDLEWNGDGDAGRPNAAPGAPSNGGWGLLARTGDTRSAGAPAWSHDGKLISYTSADKGTQDGHMRTIPGQSPNADIMTIPYNANTGKAGGAGGTASQVMGAADPAYNEYYSAFSPDDTFLAFNRVGVTDDMYFDPKAEVWVVPATGGSATRLAANDPASCVGISSPGAQNSWPKWAPAPAGGVKAASDGLLYYWVTFSSIRVKDANNPASAGKAQLYIAGVAVDPKNGNKVTTFPAVYLWNQDPTYNNLIPAWDNFTIAHSVGGPPR
jgi:hypothetical protein